MKIMSLYKSLDIHISDRFAVLCMFIGRARTYIITSIVGLIHCLGEGHSGPIKDVKWISSGECLDY